MSASLIDETRLPPPVKAVLKLNEQVLGITLLCYIVGFLITNMYLSMFGVASFEVVRIRYILVGLLFLVYLASIIFPAYGVLKIMAENEDQPIQKLISELFRHTISSYTMILFGVLVLGLFSNNRDVPIGAATTPVDYYQWFYSELPNVFYATGILVLSVPIILIIIFALMIAINPKDRNGQRNTRRHEILRTIRGINNNKKRIVFYFTFVSVFIMVLQIIISLISLYTGVNTIGAFSIGTINSSATTSSIYRWDRFIFGSLGFYIFTIMMYFPTEVMQRTFNRRQDQRGEGDYLFYGAYRKWLFLFLYLFILIVPVYANHIYPYLPQQVGGGSPIRIEVNSSNTKLTQMFVDPSIETYLIDRTSSSSILVLVNKQTQARQVMEVDKSQIESITYKTLP